MFPCIFVALLVALGGSAWAADASPVEPSIEEPTEPAQPVAASAPSAPATTTTSPVTESIVPAAADASVPAATDAKAHYARGRELYQQGQFDAAHAEFVEALRLRLPASGDHRGQAGQASGAPASAEETSAAAGAVEAPSAAAPSLPTPSPVLSEQMQNLYAAGRELYQQGRFDEAQAKFAEALAVRQVMEQAPPRAGDGAAPAGEMTMPVSASSTEISPVTTEVDIERPLPEALQTQTWLKQVRQQRRQVLRQLQTAETRQEGLRREIRSLRARKPHGAPQDKKQAQLMARLATAEQAFVQRQAAAQQWTRQAATLAKREATLWYNWGVEADWQRRPQEAMSRYREALALNPRHLDAHYNLATDFLRRRQLRQAEAEYQQVLALNPKDPDAHYNLGLITEQHWRRPQEALAHYRAYLDAAPPAAPERSIVQGWMNIIEGQRKEAERE